MICLSTKLEHVSTARHLVELSCFDGWMDGWVPPIRHLFRKIFSEVGGCPQNIQALVHLLNYRRIQDDHILMQCYVNTITMIYKHVLQVFIPLYLHV